jgi:hypothetical protein
MKSRCYRLSSELSINRINSHPIFVFKLLIWVLIGIVFILLLSKNLIATSSKSEVVFIKKLSSNCHSTITEDWHILLNDYSLPIIQTFFRHAATKRNSSYPFISGDTLRALADHIFDETTNVSKWVDRMWEIGRGDIVFLESQNTMLKHFFMNATFSQVLHPFVLVTHNSDASVPTEEFKWVLNDSRILAWFTQNPDDEHEKLFPIPIGMANTKWSHGNVTAMKRALCLHRKPFTQRTTLLYVNFAVETNKNARSKAVQWALDFTNMTQRKLLSFEDYLQEMGNSKFVVSPPGNGLDCHRTWEAILMGAIPIVLRSRLDSLFFNESVLIVDDWNQVTLGFLNSMKSPPAPSHKVLARYWHARLLQAAGRK